MATTSATSASTAISSGGLDVQGLVSQLMTAEQIPITKLTAQQASYQAKLSAFGTIQGAMSSFQGSLATLKNASSFQTVSATPSDSTVMSATALTSAPPGSYSIDVTSLAQSQKLVATGQTSVSTPIGTGAATTLTFDFGTITGTLTGGKYASGTTFTSNGNGVKTVTIDSTNNSLQGMRDAINAANIGVTASIINDGSATPYRLVLSSSNLGITNSLKISATGDASVSGLLANDPAAALGQNLSETVSASNATMQVNGILISKTSNSVSDVIPGVTLNLTKLTTIGAPVTLTVARDTTAITKSVNDFVTAFNSVNKTLSDLSAYNASTKTAAVLQGNATVRNLQAQLRGVLNTPGAGSLTSLTQIGVTFQRDGSLALDSTKLATVIQTNFTGIAGLFAATGSASDSLIIYNSTSSATKPGTYPLTVTQLPTQGNETGTAAPNLTITAGSNDTLNMNLNGINASITLTAKTYANAQALATEIQSKLNSVTALSSMGISVAGTVVGGKISVTSSSYGSLSSVVATSGNGLANIFGAAISTTGVNVAGTIDGVAATGVGQTLTAGSGNAQGLSVMINGGSLGSRGTVSYTQGYAYMLNQMATSVLASDGSLTASTNEINSSIKSLTDRTTVLQNRLVTIQARYTAQFTALNNMLANMNTTSTFLTQQLSNKA